MRVAAVYSTLALAATAANIGTQAAVTALFAAPNSVLVSVLAGTGVGLSLKYILDKRYIFRFRARGLAHEGETFILYSLMGVVTTVIFWVVEFAFHAYFKTAGMRYVGGVLGLALGYWIKYQLDRRYVFVHAATSRIVE